MLRPEEVERAADAGASFIVSPNLNAKVIEVTKRLGLISSPGCFTPSEIVEAMGAGADAVKLFPAQCLGPDFIKAMRGPLPNVRLIPTGGVTPEAARGYIAAGAWALGVGSELIGKEVMNDEGFEIIAPARVGFRRGRARRCEMMNEEAGETCLICVDAGTTNTRVWLTAGDRVIARRGPPSAFVTPRATDRQSDCATRCAN